MTITKQPWQEYREILLTIIKATETRNDHRFSAEIDKALSDERAFLFVGDDGFFVLQPQVSDAVTVVNIMFAYNEEQNAIQRYQPQIELMARQVGARKLVLQTKVARLAKSLKAVGWTLDSEINSIFHWSKIL